MKRLFTMTLIGLMFAAVSASVLAGKGKGSGDGTGPIDGCGEFIDENDDGICDICDGDGDGPKGPKGPGDGTGPIGDGDCDQFVDADGDGVCDNCDGDCEGDGPKGPRRGRNDKQTPRANPESMRCPVFETCWA